MIWALKFLWYFWTFVLLLPLALIPGKPREFVGERWDAACKAGDG